MNFDNKIHPYLVCGNYSDHSQWYFFTPDGVVEIENANRIIDCLLPKCDGSYSISELIKGTSTESSIDEKTVRKVVEILFEYDVLVDRNCIYSVLEKYSHNPMLFTQNISGDEVYNLMQSENETDVYSNSIAQKHSCDSVLGQIFENRMSTRDYIPNKISDKQIFEMFWSAYGQQTKRNKHWRYGAEKTYTVPSGGAIFPLILYLVKLKDGTVLEKGTYRWNTSDEFLQLKSQGDISLILDSIDGIDSCENATGIVVVCADFNRMSKKYANKAYPLILLEAGHVMQNAYLFCAEQNIGFVEVLGFHHENLQHSMMINKKLQPIVIGIFGGINE